MIEGYCPNCKQRYYGHSLLLPNNQYCDECGTGLLITRYGRPLIKGYSPSTTGAYRIEVNNGSVPAPIDKNDIITEEQYQHSFNIQEHLN